MASHSHTGSDSGLATDARRSHTFSHRHTVYRHLRTLAEFIVKAFVGSTSQRTAVLECESITLYIHVKSILEISLPTSDFVKASIISEEQFKSDLPHQRDAPSEPSGAHEMEHDQVAHHLRACHVADRSGAMTSTAPLEPILSRAASVIMRFDKTTLACPAPSCRS
ncbi:hypothetical protein BC834DRAFT_873848 [Gloeopeniophorella convolvens]|nr:hypothetical protein BC834DRAFT_873848 [Gloeopeniophorella convolvens]